MGVFLIIIGVILLAYISFTLGYFVNKAQCSRLERENRQLKRILNDLRRVDELSFRAFCAVAREAVKPEPAPKSRARKA